MLIFGDLKFYAQVCNKICIPIEKNFKINYFPKNKSDLNNHLKINDSLRKVPKLYDLQSSFFKKIEIDNNYASFYLTRPISTFRMIIENKVVSRLIIPKARVIEKIK